MVSSTPGVAPRTTTIGTAFSKAVASRANHDRPACTGAMSKEIEYIWGLQRVAHRQSKFIQEGSKIIKSGSSHSVQLEVKGVPTETEDAKVLHPSKSSSSAPATYDSQESCDHAVDARHTNSKPLTNFVDVPACFQDLNQGAGDSHIEVASASKDSGTHSRIIKIEQDHVHVDVCTWSLQRGMDCQVPNGLSFCVMEARCAQLGEKIDNIASSEVPEVATDSASQFNQNEDQQDSPRSDSGDTSSTERTDDMTRQTAETWDDTGKSEDVTNEKDEATIRPRDPDRCEPHETFDFHAKIEACHEPEVLETEVHQPEHEEMDERDKQESREEALESIGQEEEESEEDHVILIDRELDDSMCEQDRFIQDAKTTEEDKEGGMTDSLAETASQETVQQETNEPAEEASEENQLGEAWQVRGKEEPKERQGQIYDSEAPCRQEELMQFHLGDLGPVYVSEDKDEREGATTMLFAQDDVRVAPSHENAEEVRRSKPNATWLADEVFLARTPKAFRIHAPDEAALQTPRVTPHKDELSLPPKVLAGAVPKVVAADIPSWDRPKPSCGRGFTVPAMPSLKARAQLSMRHWRGRGSQSKHNPPNSPTPPTPEGHAKQCVLGPEMYSIGTPVPMWDPFHKLSTGLDSQSRQPAPCARPSECVLRVRLERRQLETRRQPMPISP